MSCENLNNNYPIGMKLSRYLRLYDGTNSVDFKADRSIPLVAHSRKWDTTKILTDRNETFRISSLIQEQERY